MLVVGTVVVGDSSCVGGTIGGIKLVPCWAVTVVGLCVKELSKFFFSNFSTYPVHSLDFVAFCISCHTFSMCA